MITISNLSLFTCKIGERTFQFTCDPQSQITEAKEALFQYIKYMGQVEDQIKQQMEAQAVALQEKQKEESKE